MAKQPRKHSKAELQNLFTKAAVHTTSLGNAHKFGLALTATPQAIELIDTAIAASKARPNEKQIIRFSKVVCPLPAEIPRTKVIQDPRKQRASKNLQGPESMGPDSISSPATKILHGKAKQIETLKDLYFGSTAILKLTPLGFQYVGTPETTNFLYAVASSNNRTNANAAQELLEHLYQTDTDPWRQSGTPNFRTPPELNSRKTIPLVAAIILSIIIVIIVIMLATQ